MEGYYLSKKKNVPWSEQKKPWPKNTNKRNDKLKKKMRFK